MRRTDRSEGFDSLPCHADSPDRAAFPAGGGEQLKVLEAVEILLFDFWFSLPCDARSSMRRARRERK